MSLFKNSIIIILFAYSVFFLSNTAYSEGTYVYVTDMSRIKYQIVSDGRVYFRNLNEFNGSVTGCCYAFYLDLTSIFGKTTWSTILFKMATKGDMYLWVNESNPPTHGNPAAISHTGNW